MRTAVRYRVAVAGAQLRMLMLAETPDGSIGVDLESGAFVRALHELSPDRRGPGVLDVVAAEMGPPLDPPDCARPEAVVLMEPPRRLGHLGTRRAEHYLQALQHPPQSHLLGFSGPSIPYWTLSGDRPSLTVVAIDDGPQVRWTSSGFECRFTWQGVTRQYPLGDAALVATLRRLERPRCGGRDLVRLLGYRPRRLLVVLSPPVDGYCFKEVAALLPGRRNRSRGPAAG